MIAVPHLQFVACNGHVSKSHVFSPVRQDQGPRLGRRLRHDVLNLRQQFLNDATHLVGFRPSRRVLKATELVASIGHVEPQVPTPLTIFGRIRVSL